MILSLLACGAVELDVDPTSLDFGTLDFSAEMPAEGYAQDRVTLTNVGKATGTLWLPEYDTQRLCIAGFDEDRDYPVELGPIEPGQYYVLDVGVCGFGDGELDSEVAVDVGVLIDDDPDPVSFTVTYTPVLSGDGA